MSALIAHVCHLPDPRLLVSAVSATLHVLQSQHTRAEQYDALDSPKRRC